MIIDFRVRAPLRDEGDPPVEFPEMMGRYVPEYHLDEKAQATFEDLDSKSKAAGIDLCVIHGEIEEPGAERMNNRVKEVVDRDPKRYVGFGGIDPTEPGARH